MLPMMMVLSVLITGIYYLYSRKTIENSTYSLIAAEAKAESVSISKYIIKTLSQLDAVGDSMESNGINEDYVKSLRGKYGLETGIYLYTADGRYLDSTDFVINDDIKQKEWYKEGQEHIGQLEATNISLEKMRTKVTSCASISTDMSAIAQEQSASVEEVLATIETLAENSKMITKESHKVQNDAESILGISEAVYDSIKDFKID